MTLFLSIYTYFFAAMLALTLVAKVLMKVRGSYDKTPRAVQLEEAVLMPFMLLGLLGCIGYVNQVAFGVQWLWQSYTAVFFLLLVAGYWMPKLQWMKAEFDRGKFLVFFLLANAMNLPFLYMLVQYAYLGYPSG